MDLELKVKGRHGEGRKEEKKQMEWGGREGENKKGEGKNGAEKSKCLYKLLRRQGSQGENSHFWRILSMGSVSAVSHLTPLSGRQF